MQPDFDGFANPHAGERCDQIDAFYYFCHILILCFVD